MGIGWCDMKEVVRIGSVDELVQDFITAMDLLLQSGPNPLVCDNEDLYWEELHKLQEKYMRDEEVNE